MKNFNPSGLLNTVPTKYLIEFLSSGEPTTQEDINACALELVKRIWVPNHETTFEEMLYKFGYRYPEELGKNRLH